MKLWTLALALLLIPSGVSAQQQDPIPTTRVSTLLSRILAIDPAALTLRLDQADPEDLFAAGPALRQRFAQLAANDQVNVTFYRPRVIRVIRGGGGTLPAGVRPGQSPGVRPFIADITVLAIDREAPTITVHHNVLNVDRTYDVLQPHLLDSIEVGETLTLFISRPLISEISPAP